jgi:hypothetical protein
MRRTIGTVNLKAIYWCELYSSVVRAKWTTLMTQDAALRWTSLMPLDIVEV